VRSGAISSAAVTKLPESLWQAAVELARQLKPAFFVGAAKLLQLALQ
jgi:hypothetical protein